MNEAPHIIANAPRLPLSILAALCHPSPHAQNEPVFWPDWSELMAQAEAHGVSGLLVAGLLAGRAGTLSEEWQEGLEVWHEGQLLQAEDFEAQLAKWLRYLSDQGVKVMPIKGPLVAHQAYSNPAQRSYHDLDVLIRPEDIDRTVSSLEQAGFVHQHNVDQAGLAHLRRYAGEYVMYFREDLPVEPHWLLAPWTMALDIDLPAIWQRAEATQFLGASAYLPVPADHFLMLVVHGTKEQWHRLKWPADLAAFLMRHPNLDLIALRRDAARQGLARAFDVALLLSHRLFTVPSAAPSADRVAQRLVDTICARLAQTAEAPPGPYVVTQFHWLVRERWRDRLRFALRTWFTPRLAQYQRLNLPPHLRWVHVLIKLPWDCVVTPLARKLR